MLARYATLVLLFATPALGGSPAASDITSLRVRADSLFRAGWFGAADSVESKIESARRDDPEGLRRRGAIALLENRLADARRLLERAMAKAPDDTSVRTLLARTCLRADDFPPAARLYEAMGRKSLGAKLASFGDRLPYRISGDTTTVVFVNTDPLPLIQARVNGSDPIFLLIDTGGAELILDSTFAATLKVPRYGTDTGTYAGGRRAALEHGRADSLILGGITIHDLPVQIQNTQRYSAAAQGLPVSGILGTSVLRHFLATIDYPAGRLVLAPRGRGSGPPPGGHAIDMPFWMAGDHLMLARGQVGTSPSLLWFVDTGLAGAAFTCPEATLHEAGIPIPETGGLEGTGGGGRIRVTPFAVPRLTLGEAEARNLLGIYGPFPPGLEYGQGFRIAGIVSHAFLRPYAMTLDFDRMRLTLTSPAR